MKHPPALALLPFSLFLAALTAGRAQATAAGEIAPATASASVSADDWAGIRAAHEAERRTAIATPEGLVAVHCAQSWRSAFDGRGVTIAPDDGAWTWGLELERWGFAGALREIDGVAAGCAAGERVEYDWDGALTEWYLNGASGLEHGYTVHRRPEGDGPLVFELLVRGGLAPAIDPDGRGARFVDGSGAQVLSYAGLAVYDATGLVLDARLGTRGEGLSIEIHERDARYPLTIDPAVQPVFLKASNTGAFDMFGYSVAVSGDTIVVGAAREDSGATGVNGDEANDFAHDAGAVYVFVQNGSTWVQQAYLKPSNSAFTGGFGASVAIDDDTIVVGTPGDSSDATGVNGNDLNTLVDASGAAFVFVRSGGVWTQQAYLKASNTGAGDFFGHSVAISGDTVVIGAPGEGSDSTGVDGDQTATSSRYNGAAYVFVRQGSAWTQQAYLKASNTGWEDEFGTSVSISGNTVVVGAPYEDSLATGVNGNQSDNDGWDQGAAYVFVRSGAAWSHQAYLKASNAVFAEGFGLSVSVSGDTVAVGAERTGRVHVFARNAATWNPHAVLRAWGPYSESAYGTQVAISGDRLIVGSPGEQSGGVADGTRGATYLFIRRAGEWTRSSYLKASNMQFAYLFGASVAIDDDTAVVGAWHEMSDATGVNGAGSNFNAHQSGAAYTYRVTPEAVPYCFGDGTGSVCPCSPVPVPHGAPGRGCPTNVFAGGGRATATGGSSLTSDTLALTGMDMVNGSMTFYQGATQQSGGAGFAFGDGLRCIQPSGIRRLTTRAVVGNTARYPDAGDPPISVAGFVVTPGVLYYQGWYRSASPSFCTPSTFNFTNGLAVTWVP